MNCQKKRILILSDYFLPGFKAGGPIRSLQGIIERLSDEFEFIILSRDRDYGDTEPYPGIITNQWNVAGNSEVFYLNPGQLKLRYLRKLLSQTKYDVLYLNSFFSWHFTIKPLFLRLVNAIPMKNVVLAPRGEFSSGALKLKFIKKKIFIMFAKVSRLYANIVWQASSEFEAADIANNLGLNFRKAFSSLIKIAPQIIVAEDLSFSLGNHRSVNDEKIPGKLKIVFLSRICRKKNLKYALEQMNALSGEVIFDIYGPLEDPAYWEECEQVISTLPDNILVRYVGVAANDQVIRIMNKYHIFFFPTLGENFGHVILEALRSGCPILISDQTPWRGLEELGIGWDLSLDDSPNFQRVLQYCIDMNNESYQLISRRANEYGEMKACSDEAISQNRLLFRAAMATQKI